MSKFLFAIMLMSLLACGTGESDSGATGAADMPPVSASGSSGDAAGAIEVEEVEMAAGEQKPAEAAEISSCIRLVKSADYEAALPACLKAAKIDPDNKEVKAALAKAETEAAKKATSGAASDAAADALSGLGD